MTTEAESHIHHPNYVKIWAILVALLIASVLGSMSHIREVVLIAAFGVALVKAYLVAKNFMHVNGRKALGALSFDRLPAFHRDSYLQA